MEKLSDLKEKNITDKMSLTFLQLQKGKFTTNRVAVLVPTNIIEHKLKKMWVSILKQDTI